ncbi:MAG: hypothetical protein HYV09_30210 [Deltaproteobacteria bacterium]|nr:hypothetical protein [Deltaproteobacteria bacterium]
MNKWIFALSLALPATASAAETPAVPPAASATQSEAPRFWAIDAGLRYGFIRDAAFDPYSDSDLLLQGTVGVSRTALVADRFSLAPGLRWDSGSTRATARGADTLLLVHRVTMPVEGRFHLHRRIYAFGRVAPGALWQRATVQDASLPETSKSSGWVFAGDLSAGASLMFIDTRGPKFWFTPEIGYAFAARRSGGLSPDVGDDDPRQFGTLQLSGTKLSGWFFRANVTATF